MKTIEKASIPPEKSRVLKTLKNRLSGKFGIEEIILFGSVARGEADDESDCDLLFITGKPMNRFERHKITDEVFEINLLYDMNFSSLVVDRASWENGPVSVLAIHDEIRADGIAL